MSEPFIGEVQIFGFPYPPRNWSFADGSLLAIRQSSTLFALYGTSFGGDGVTTFGLPNLTTQGACSTGQSPGNSQRSLGQTFGTAAVSLTATQTPMHNHTLSDYQSDAIGAQGAVPTVAGAIGFNDGIAFVAPPGTAAIMSPSAITVSGEGSPHENRQPFLGLNYSVALFGTYPYFD